MTALTNACRATVLVKGRNELHLKFNNDTELRQAYAELDAIAWQQAEPCIVCNALFVQRNATHYDAEDLAAARIRGHLIAERLAEQIEAEPARGSSVNGHGQQAEDTRLTEAMAIINAAWLAVPVQYRDPDADDSTGNPLPAAVRALAAGQQAERPAPAGQAVTRAAQAALDAYEDRFESTRNVGNYLGPIDDEMKALRAALASQAERQIESSGNSG